jgi:hypothetical protein
LPEICAEEPEASTVHCEFPKDEEDPAEIE